MSKHTQVTASQGRSMFTTSARIARILTIPAILAAALLNTACSSTSEPPPPATATTDVTYQKGEPGGVVVNTVDLSAKVTAIDKAKRKVTLQGADGGKFTVTVGPQAVNFDQIRVGDHLNITVTEELVVYLDKEGTASADSAAGMVALAPKGSKPAGIVAGTTQVTGTVTAIDLQNRTATLQFADGTTRTFPVRNDVDLNKRKVGEKVVFRVTEMVAISVDKP